MKFTLDQMTIPSYSAQYFTNMTTETIQNSDGTTTTKKVLEEKTSETAVVFKIEDQMDPGITLKAPIEIKVGGSVFATISEADLHSASKEEANYTYKYQAASGTEGETGRSWRRTGCALRRREWKPSFNLVIPFHPL